MIVPYQGSAVVSADEKFFRFLQLRRLERERIEEEKDDGKPAKRQRPTESNDVKPLALMDKQGQAPMNKQGRAPARTALVQAKGKSSRAALVKAKPVEKDTLGADLDKIIDQAKREQERDLKALQAKYAQQLKGCLSPDGMVRVDRMASLVKLMERTSAPADRLVVLQALQQSAQDPDSRRWARFMEMRGMPVLREWLTKAAHPAGAVVEGEADKLVCGCLHVLRRLPLSFDRARAEGLLQACADLGSGCPTYIRKLANDLIADWQATGAEKAHSSDAAESADDSELESVDESDSSSGDEAPATRTAAAAATRQSSARQASGSAPVLTAEQRAREEETKSTVEELKKLGMLLEPKAQSDRETECDQLGSDHDSDRNSDSSESFLTNWCSGTAA